MKCHFTFWQTRKTATQPVRWLWETQLQVYSQQAVGGAMTLLLNGSIGIYLCMIFATTNCSIFRIKLTLTSKQNKASRGELNWFLQRNPIAELSKISSILMIEYWWIEKTLPNKYSSGDRPHSGSWVPTHPMLINFSGLILSETVFPHINLPVRLCPGLVNHFHSVICQCIRMTRQWLNDADEVTMDACQI